MWPFRSTVDLDDASAGSLFLCLKRAERCHTPREQWERLKLSMNLVESISQINEATKVGISVGLTQKCKLRLKRWREVLRRMRREALTQKTKLAPVKKKTDRREAIRERKAEIAARLDNAIEQELLSRLSKGVYGELYQFEKEAEVESEKEEEAVPAAARRRRAKKHLEIEYDEEDAREMAR
ncbi:Mak16 protein [Babesia caballi]|uniref:Mak16 protein n=1 Tax=Babesia caballi TaxID=5871 RepID=A0AAV4LRF7_BABCB|nr:Mak16 protein [Babesia caballi]